MSETADLQVGSLRPGAHRGYDVELSASGVAWIRFNQPERLNGLRQSMKRDLVETLVQAQMDDAVRVVVFIGSGRAFSAGDDISGRPVEGEPEGMVPDVGTGHHNSLGTYSGLRYLSQPLNQAVRGLNKLTVAAINGVAIQTGFSLALCCDFRLAARSSRIGSATLRFGLLPDEGGQYLLVRTLGLPTAMDFLMRKRIVGAEEAQQLGLVHEVVEDDDLERRAGELAQELAEGPQVAMRLLKRSLYNAADLSWEQALDEIASKTPIADHHPDAREGVEAFQQKRRPRFNRWLEPTPDSASSAEHSADSTPEDRDA